MSCNLNETNKQDSNLPDSSWKVRKEFRSWEIIVVVLFNASKGQASLNKTTHTIPPPFLIFTFSVTSSQTTIDEVFIEVGKFRQTSRVCRTFVTNIFPRKNTRLKTANQRQLAQGKHQSPVIYFSSHNALGIEINHSAFHLTRDGWSKEIGSRFISGANRSPKILQELPQPKVWNSDRFIFNRRQWSGFIGHRSEWQSQTFSSR